MSPNQSRRRTVDPNRLLEMKIGGFVLAALLVAAGVIFLLGQEKHMFEENVPLHSEFKDVAGLRDGAAVRLSGVNVGTVTRVSFKRDLRDPRIQVDFEVTRAALDRIRKDSAVRIGGEGLLGDKIIEISLGSASEPKVAPNGIVQSQEATDLNRVAEKAAEVMDKMKTVADNAASLLQGVGDKKTVAKIQGSVSSMRAILQAVEKGPGLAHAIFYDAQSKRMFTDTLAELNRGIASTQKTIAHVEKILGSTDENGKQLVNHAALAAKQIGEAAQELKRSNVVSNLEKASADLAGITKHIRSGRGTVGGVIADPTIYHQLVNIVGGVERSKILRAIVRYAVGKDDGQSATVGLQSAE